jgi:uncharacterized protein YPO0396
MAEMPFADAADIVRRVARDRLQEARAFEQIDGALAAAVTVQSSLVRLTKERDELAATIAGMQEEHAAIHAAFTDEQEKLAETLYQQTEDVATRQATLETAFATLERSRDDLRETLMREADAGRLAERERTRALETMCAGIELQHREVLADLQRRVAEAQATLRQTQQQFAQLVKDATQTAGIAS